MLKVYLFRHWDEFPKSGKLSINPVPTPLLCFTVASRSTSLFTRRRHRVATVLHRLFTPKTILHFQESMLFSLLKF